MNRTCTFEWTRKGERRIISGMIKHSPPFYSLTAGRRQRVVVVRQAVREALFEGRWAKKHPQGKAGCRQGQMGAEAGVGAGDWRCAPTATATSWPVMMDRWPRTAETRAAAESTAAEEGPAAGPYVPPEGERRTAVPTTALEEVPAAAERWRLVEGLVLQQKL